MAIAKNILPSNLTIPTIPTVLTRIEKLVQDPKSGMKEYADVISSDAPLTARVLKIANSSYYGLRERCMSTQQAAVTLGLRVLRNVVTQAAVIEQSRGLATLGFDLDALWKHSIMTAQTCNFIARRCRNPKLPTPDELYVCGLLHDLGQIVLLDNLKQDYVAIARQAQAEGLPLHVAERNMLGFDHAEAGSLIAVRWGLPAQMAGAIQHHHTTADVAALLPEVLLVARTNLLVHRVFEGNRSGAAEIFDPQVTKVLNLSGDDVTAAIEFVERSMQHVVI